MSAAPTRPRCGRRRLACAAELVLAWIFGGALLHFVVFPEPTPDAADRPGRGTVARLPDGSRFVYLQSAADSDGALFEAAWSGPPGAGIGRHTHPSQEVRFQIHEGELHVVAGALEHLLGPGEEITIPTGVAHQWRNRGPATARGVFQLRPAGRADFVFEQMDRAFGGERAGAFASAMQTFVLIGAHGEHTSWPIETLRFLVAPTARLFGYRSYYPPR